MANAQRPVLPIRRHLVALDYIPQPDYFPAAGVYVVNADGIGLHRMFDSGNMWVDFWAGSWSPDGGWIMYTRAEYAVYNNQVYLNASYIEYNNASWYFPPPRFSWTELDMNPDWQTADLKPPVSSITPLPQYSRARGFTVEWSGIDYGLAGVGSYDLETRINGGPWTAWKSGTTETSATYTGSGGQTVAIRGRARDNAANLESWPADSETSTTL